MLELNQHPWVGVWGWQEAVSRSEGDSRRWRPRGEAASLQSLYPRRPIQPPGGTARGSQIGPQGEHEGGEGERETVRKRRRGDVAE